MVEHQVGLGILPETAALKCRRTMAIRTIRLTDPWATRRLLLCLRGLDELPPLARELAAHLSRYPQRQKTPAKRQQRKSA
jgi:hypothetical protein